MANNIFIYSICLLIVVIFFKISYEIGKKIERKRVRKIITDSMNESNLRTEIEILDDEYCQWEALQDEEVFDNFSKAVRRLRNYYNDARIIIELLYDKYSEDGLDVESISLAEDLYKKTEQNKKKFRKR